MHRGYAVQQRSLYRISIGNVGQVRGVRIRQSAGTDYESDEFQEPREDAEHPDDSEDIENGMGHGRPLGRGISHRSSDIGRDGGTDIFSQNHCGSQFERYHAGRDEKHDDRHRGGRRLETDGKHRSDKQEEQYRQVHRPEMKVRQCLQTAQVNVVEQYSGCLLQFGKTHEEQCETDDDFSQVSHFLVLLVHHHDESQRYERERNRGNVIREPENRHNP